MGTLHLRQSTSSWLKERGHALSLPEQQQQQQQQQQQLLPQQQQRDFLQRPASETPFGGPAMRQLEVLPPMKRSASADSLPAVPTEDVSHPHAISFCSFTSSCWGVYFSFSVIHHTFIGTADEGTI